MWTRSCILTFLKTAVSASLNFVNQEVGSGLNLFVFSCPSRTQTRGEVLKEKELLSALDSWRWPAWHGEEGAFMNCVMIQI